MSDLSGPHMCTYAFTLSELLQQRPVSAWLHVQLSPAPRPRS